MGLAASKVAEAETASQQLPGRTKRPLAESESDITITPKRRKLDSDGFLERPSSTQLHDNTTDERSDPRSQRPSPDRISDTGRSPQVDLLVSDQTPEPTQHVSSQSTLSPLPMATAMRRFVAAAHASDEEDSVDWWQAEGASAALTPPPLSQAQLSDNTKGIQRAIESLVAVRFERDHFSRSSVKSTYSAKQSHAREQDVLPLPPFLLHHKPAWSGYVWDEKLTFLGVRSSRQRTVNDGVSCLGKRKFHLVGSPLDSRPATGRANRQIKLSKFWRDGEWIGSGMGIMED